MTTPASTELIFYTNKPLDNQDWKTNFLKIIEWLTAGTYDFTINDMTMNGALTVTGAITSSGAITGATLVGDGSAITNIGLQFKNWIVNADARVNTISTAFTLVKDTYGSGVILHEGMATGTAVNAGTMTRTASASVGTAGYAIKFAGLTITGTGIVYHRYRIAHIDAVNFKNQFASFSCKVYHDVGSAITYTIFIRKADVEDNFAAVTEISNDSGTSVASATATTLEFENVSMGDPSNGIEIEIKIECGAITTKNFENTEFQLEVNSAATDFESKVYNEEFANIITKEFLQATDDLLFVDADQDFGVASAKKIFLDVTAGVGADTYFISNVDNQINAFCGATEGLRIQAASLAIPEASKFYFDGVIATGDTFMHSPSSNIWELWVGGSKIADGDSNQLNVGAGIIVGTNAADNHIDDSTHGSGSATLYIGNETIDTTSDKRLKKNIKDTKIDSMALINKLRVVDYEWNDKVEKGDSRKVEKGWVGMIAQEMIKVAPWTIHSQGGKSCKLCNTGKECKKHPNPWKVKYDQLVPVLVKAMQELNKKIKKLEGK